MVAMDGKRLALLVGALLLAGVSAFLARSMMMGSAAPSASAAQVPTGPEVLVAIRALPVGTIIGADSLRYQPWPKDMVENVYYTRGTVDPATLNGAVVRSEVTAGQPLTMGSLVKPGDRGFLAAALGPGMRAVTVPVSAQSGVGGFVFPGDRIDLVLTQAVTGGGDGPPLKTSETIIRNLRVLATDQRTDNATTSADGKSNVIPSSTVTLEATPKIAEKIAVAQTIGTLSLSLRSIADNTAELERAIASGAVTVPQNGDPKAEKQMLLQIASQPIDTDTTFTVGADVSRFQRRTVPAKPASGPAGIAMGAPAPQVASADGLGARPSGPVVRVARGNTVTIVPAGGK